MIPQLLQPPRNVLVGLVFADIVDQERTYRSSVIGGCDGSISLLPSGIPNLCLDRLRIYLDGSGRKLYTDGGLRVEVELIAGESTQEVGLSNTRVSDQDH